VTDERALAAAVERLAPEVIINCAAWTDVDGAESDPEGAAAVNARGAGNVARAAGAHGARLVHVSTDYVFDGQGTRPYVESDPTGPTGVYGASKLAGEIEVLQVTAPHAIVRTAWLFGAGGQNFVDTMLRLAHEGRDEVSVVTDQLGCPTWTGHLAPALVEVAARGLRGIMHVAGGGQCSWNDLAREVYEQAGLDVQVQPATTAQYLRPARRPAFSVLGTAREDSPRLPDWREGVRRYLSAAGHAGAVRVGAVSQKGRS